MMTLEQAIELKKINLHEYHAYVCFNVNEHGVKYLKYLKDALFMEEADISHNTNSAVFLDGRKSIVRDFYFTISKVDAILTGEDKNERSTRNN